MSVWMPIHALSGLQCSHEPPQCHQDPQAATNLLTLEVADGEVVEDEEAAFPALALNQELRKRGVRQWH